MAMGTPAATIADWHDADRSMMLRRSCQPARYRAGGPIDAHRQQLGAGRRPTQPAGVLGRDGDGTYRRGDPGWRGVGAGIPGGEQQRDLVL